MKPRKFKTSLPKKVEEEITNHMKNINNMTKIFHSSTNYDVRNFVLDVASDKGIVTRLFQETGMTGGGCLDFELFYQKESLLHLSPRKQLVLACCLQ